MHIILNEISSSYPTFYSQATVLSIVTVEKEQRKATVRSTLADFITFTLHSNVNKRSIELYYIIKYQYKLFTQ